jgi:D-lactate dehydrogenase
LKYFLVLHQTTDNTRRTTADRYDIPVTFRAVGTSLFGQAILDSVLIVAANNWKNYEIPDQGRKIRLQPGVIGAQANRYLAPYGKKIGPDPASINAAMIGGNSHQQCQRHVLRHAI